jgi:hypothetical protein
VRPLGLAYRASNSTDTAIVSVLHTLQEFACTPQLPLRATSSHSITAHDANEPSLSDQAPPMQRATINHLSSETALPNRSRIAECRRKSQNIVALAGFASGRAPAVREPAAFIFCLPIPPVCLLVFLLVSAAIGDENYFKFN